MTRRNLSIALLSLGSVATVNLTAPHAMAQTASTGTVTGFVLDPDQAAIPGATVTLTPAKGAALTTTSGADGGYTFRGVPTGTYSLTVSMSGFASFVRQGVRVNSSTVTINTAMAVQSANTEIDVTTQSNTVSVDPDSNGSAVVLKDKDLEALSDDPDELSDELTALAGPSAGPNGGQIYVDGFTGGQLPPKSSIREIRVNQNPFSAQFDKQGFGRVEVFTKPGTDTYHGTASVQFNDKVFNTSSPFLGSANQQPSYHRLFFIASLTGPLTRTSSYSLAGSHRTIQDNSIFAGSIISTGPDSGVLCAPGNPACSLNPLPESLRATFHPQTRYDFTPRIDLALGKSNTLTIRYQLEHGSATNAGLGSTSLSSVASNTSNNENQIQISDTQILSQRIINETRLALVRAKASSLPQSFAPTVSLSGYFSGGGASGGTSNTTSDRLELQNYTSVALQKNFIRAGMRLRIYRDAQYATGGSNGTFSYSSAANYIANKPFQYRVMSIATPKVNGYLSDIGIYAEDDWRARPNLTVSYGVRYEAQSDINSKADIAPRFAVSFGIPRKKGNPTTVLRTGFGIFYDRFDIAQVLNSYQQNGVNQIALIYSNPTGVCAPGNTAGCGTGGASSQTIYQLAPNLRSAYNMQSVVGVDQQVGKRSTLSFNYLSNVGVHQFLSRSLPTTGTNKLYSYQSGGVFRQNQFIVNFRTQLGTKFSLTGFYALNYAKSNANGASAFPTDSLNSRTDYGRALFVQKHRITFFGNWQAPFGINASPFMVFNTGSYYNVTAGSDLNGDTVNNDRAGFANGVSGNCRTYTDFTASVSSTNRVPPGYCTGPANVQFNLRLVKAFGFGKRTRPAGADAAAAGPDLGAGVPRGGGGGPRGGGGGGGARGGGGGGRSVSSGHKYNFNAGVQVQNLFNYVPYSTPNASLSSPLLFGKSQSLTGGMGNSGSAVRTVTLQLNFNF
ncbi:TonB-dependent receptor [Terriglobus roseus]|uniref:TonB-dependent receptor n=1 Tax=Terriglobus roseus TaxID=392734 RepID=UPI001FCD31F5|nr:carboxypeptidase-like regulatory domain-containing protein [Terriglobus roseus]